MKSKIDKYTNSSWESKKLNKLEVLVSHAKREIEYEESKGELRLEKVSVSEMRGTHSVGMLIHYTLNDEFRALSLISFEGDDESIGVSTQFYKLGDL